MNRSAWSSPLVLVGRLLETKAREGTGKAVQSLIKLRPRNAHKLNAASPENVEWLNPANFTDMDIDTIAVGDLLVVKNGERVPTDGIIVAGNASIDESMITGESKPVTKTTGAAVTGATVLLKGDLVMQSHSGRCQYCALPNRGDGGPRAGNQSSGAAAGR